MLARNFHFGYGISVVVIMTIGLIITDRSVSARRSEHIANTLPTPATTERSPFAEYRGVTIGMAADDLRKKLGVPKDKSDAQDFYAFSENESAQFYYDDAHHLMAIMITFMGDLKTAPTPKDVFGEAVPAKPDGGVSKMVRFPKAGYWISYNRGGGSDAILSIAIQKI